MIFISDRARKRAERLTLGLAKRFQKNEDGATAVEFAIVALPFFALLFGILELAIVFFVNSALVHATADAGRKIRTGNFQACGAENEFKALVCAEMDNMASCWNNLRIDVVTGPDFKTIAVPSAPAPQEPVTDASGNTTVPPTPNGVYNANSAGDPLVIRSTFYYRLALPPLLTRLDNPKGSGVRVLTATTAFRNEPFPVSGTCEPSTSTAIAEGTPST